ncbi:MAG: hypothetical protein WBZ19_05810, partial [Chthoniobacterales bacterium]
MNRTQQKRRPKRLVLKRHGAPLAKRPHALHHVDPLRQPQAGKSEIHQILVPVDAIHTKVSDFSPILRMARRLGAAV